MTLLPKEHPQADAFDSDADGHRNGYHAPLGLQGWLGEPVADWRPREDLGSISIAPASCGTETETRSSSWPIERWLLSQLLDRLDDPQFDVQLWDGTVIPAGIASPAPDRLCIRQRAALWKLCFNPAYHFPEGYARGLIEVEGDLLNFLCVLNSRWRRHHPRLLSAWHQWLHASLRRITPAGSRKNVEHHYDLGNDFYRLWLDEQLVYTCAYFPQPGMSLEAAQVAKLDHVCRKLRLRPGEEVIEAGCGWGALALHMARHYGVRVRACNVSIEQIRFAKSLAAQQGLADRVEFVLDDWRNLKGNCDAFVSVGMLEHVGPENFQQLGQVIERCLSPHGRGLIHTIGQNYPLPLNPWIERRIFPGAEPPALEQIVRIFTAGDLTVHDVENLHLHYAETLWHWLQRFEQHVETIRRTHGEPFVRMWRMYLASSYSAFETGGLQLYQIVFSPTDSNRVSRTRADWYRSTNAVPNGLATANRTMT